MSGYLNAFAKLCITVPLAVLFLLPIGASSDSELPVNVAPRPSEPDLEQLLSILRTTPENGWVRVNTNQMQDVWTPTGLLMSSTKLPNSNPWGPRGIISAYSGFAWDSRRGDLIIYGGGHANYGGNDVYRWRATALDWERMSLPSDVKTLDPLPWLTVDGPNASPPSAHTYDNNIYLPIVDRFLTVGGPTFGGAGDPFFFEEPNGSFRVTGPYFFDPARADENKVGGLTGSHPQWNNLYLGVIGGEMWENRDVPLNLPTAPFPRHFVEGSTGYTQENGKDVVFVHSGYGVLSKYTINDIDDPTQDTWEHIGQDFSVGPGAGAYLPTHNLYLRISPGKFTYWDLANASPTNLNVSFVPEGDFVAMSSGTYNYGLGDYGMDYDAPRNRFLLWVGGGDVWALTPPPTVSPIGWTIEKLESATAQTPLNAAGAGILGKWKYIAQLDAFMTVQDRYAGNIWIYKPENWVDPSNSDDPHITIAEPTSKGYFLPNEDIVVTAVTANEQSDITQVELLMGGQTLAVITEPPYTATVPSVLHGIYTFEAIATDGNGDTWISPRVAATVADHVNNPPSVSMTAPLDGTIVYVEGRTVTLAADASDSDGSIARVEFFLNGASVGVDTSAPYSIIWEAQEGNHTLTAAATDDTEITTVSDALEFSVTPPGDGDLLVLQDGLDGYSGTTDTYLDSYHSIYPKGSKQWINSSNNQFNPLVRFAIFDNEGGPVPQGATITFAALALYKSSFYDYTYRAHPLLVDWDESEATWVEAADGVPWYSPGAAGAGSDYAADGSPQRYTGWNPGWLVLDVTDSVQSISAGEQSNNGWQMIGTGPNYQKTFRASEYSADPTLRPKLILQIDSNSNSQPSVALTTPIQGAYYNDGDIITLSADATDADGTVTQVEFFYSNALLGVSNVSLGVDTAAPFTVDWSGAPVGNSTLTAVATDDGGASVTSEAVTITAFPPGC